MSIQNGQPGPGSVGITIVLLPGGKLNFNFPNNPDGTLNEALSVWLLHRAGLVLDDYIRGSIKPQDQPRIQIPDVMPRRPNIG